MVPFPQRRVFPEDDPSLCVTFFTCHGTGVAGSADLEETYPSAVRYLDSQDGLRYELVWLDNGSEQRVLDDFVSRGAQLDRLLRNPTNEGLFRAVNDVWFRGRGCRAPYVLSLEDDRVARPGRSWRLPHAQLSIRLLQHAGDSVLGVRLKREWSDDAVAAAQPGGGSGAPRWLSVPGEGTRPALRYTTHCFAPASNLVWGSFTMAAVVYDRERLRARVGLFAEGEPHDEMPYDYSEGQYAVRAGLGGGCTARPDFDDACADDADTSAERAAPCHDVFLERRPPRPRDLSETDWFFWGTQLHPRNRTATTASTATASTAALASPGSGGSGGSGSGSGSGGSGGSGSGSGRSEPSPTIDCAGQPLPPAAADLYVQLGHGTRLASQSEPRDYSLAAAAYRGLELEFGSMDAVVAAFECTGVTAFYANHLRSWPLPPGTPPPPPPPPTSTPSSKSSSPSASPEGGWARGPGARVVSWRTLPAGDAAGVRRAIPRLIFQTWKDARLPPKFEQLALRVRRLHPDFSYVLFTDADIEAFVRERTPTWLPLWRGLSYAPIQRVDLFRYLAVWHFGGFYVDLDVMMHAPLGDELLEAPQRAVFPFERLVEPDGPHAPLVAATGSSSLIGQYAFGAAAGHPFVLAILRYVARAARDPAWARVPVVAAASAGGEGGGGGGGGDGGGDKGDDKTVHYTTGPALVSRAFFEGGFASQVHLLYGSALGPDDERGWGQLGMHGAHMHAGTWKQQAGGEFDLDRLMARARAHAARGETDAAAELVKRAAMHGAGVGDKERNELFATYFALYDEAGRLGEARLEMAQTYGAAGLFRQAGKLLRDAVGEGDGGGEGGEGGEGGGGGGGGGGEGGEGGGGRLSPREALELSAPRESLGMWERLRILWAGEDGYVPAAVRPATPAAAKFEARASYTRWLLHMWRLVSCRGGGGLREGEEPCVQDKRWYRAEDDTNRHLKRAMALMPTASRYRRVWAVQVLRQPAIYAAGAVPEMRRAMALEEAEARAAKAAAQAEAQAKAKAAKAAEAAEAAAEAVAETTAEATAAAAMSQEACDAADVDAAAAADDDDDDAVATPHAHSALLYLWSLAPALRPAMLANPPLGAALLGTMLKPRDGIDAVAATRCEFEDAADAQRAAAVAATLPPLERAANDVLGPSQLVGTISLEKARAATAGRLHEPPGATHAKLMVNAYGIPVIVAQ